MRGSVGVLPSYVRYNSNLNSSAKLLYAEITANLDDHGLFCDLTNKELATLMGWEERSIQRLLSSLISARVIERVTVGNKRTLTLRIPTDSAIHGPPSSAVVEYTESLIHRWNQLFGSSIAFRNAYVDMVADRLKKYDKETIGNALRNWVEHHNNDPFWKDKRSYITDIGNVLSTDDAIEEYNSLS